MHHILVLIQDHYSMESVCTARIKTNTALICFTHRNPTPRASKKSPLSWSNLDYTPCSFQSWTSVFRYRLWTHHNLDVLFIGLPDTATFRLKAYPHILGFHRRLQVSKRGGSITLGNIHNICYSRPCDQGDPRSSPDSSDCSTWTMNDIRDRKYTKHRYILSRTLLMRDETQSATLQYQANGGKKQKHIFTLGTATTLWGESVMLEQLYQQNVSEVQALMQKVDPSFQ